MSKLQEIRVPDIGNFHDVPVIEIAVKEGDIVSAEDTLVTLESEKASMDIPSPHAGKVTALKVKLGDTVSEGSVIALMEVMDAPQAVAPVEKAPPIREAEPALAPPVAASPPMPSATVREDSAPRGAPVHASPSVRRFARELGVELAQVKGSGPKRRITRDDVQAFVKAELSKPRTGGGLALQLPDVPQPDYARFGPVEMLPLSKIRRLSGANLHRNWIMAPHVTQFDEADVTDLEAFRKSLQREAEQAGAKLTLLPFLMKVLVAALQAHPEFNASLAPDGESLIVKKYFHIGFAVDTPDGLVVPVVNDVDKKGVFALAGELAGLSQKARARKLAPSDMQGGTITISSLGGIGGHYFTPILNSPEVAILGVSRATMKPHWNGEGFVPRLMLPLSLSYDHRVIDGAQGAHFITTLNRLLADPRRLML